MAARAGGPLSRPRLATPSTRRFSGSFAGLPADALLAGRKDGQRGHDAGRLEGRGICPREPAIVQRCSTLRQQSSELAGLSALQALRRPDLERRGDRLEDLVPRVFVLDRIRGLVQPLDQSAAPRAPGPARRCGLPERSARRAARGRGSRRLAGAASTSVGSPVARSGRPAESEIVMAHGAEPVIVLCSRQRLALNPASQRAPRQSGQRRGLGKSEPIVGRGHGRGSVHGRRSGKMRHGSATQTTADGSSRPPGEGRSTGRRASPVRGAGGRHARTPPRGHEGRAHGGDFFSMGPGGSSH
jgi:hypothetical protein